MVGEEFFLGGGGVGLGCGEKGWLLGKIGRDESYSGVSGVLAKMQFVELFCLSWKGI